MTSSIFGKDSGIPGNDGSRLSPINAIKAVFDHPDIQGDPARLVDMAQDQDRWRKFMATLPESTVDEMYSFAVGGGFIKEDVDHHGQSVPPTI